MSPAILRGNMQKFKGTWTLVGALAVILSMCLGLAYELWQGNERAHGHILRWIARGIVIPRTSILFCGFSFIWIAHLPAPMSLLIPQLL